MSTDAQPKQFLISFHAITFLHPGTGQSTGAVDLPVQREVHTGFPMIASTGIKGSLRDKAESSANFGNGTIRALFGGDPDSPGAGAVTVTDARILAFPVRSLEEVFFWITCPMILKRLDRDRTLIGLPFESWPTFDIKEGKVTKHSKSSLEGTVTLEEIALETSVPESSDKAAEIIASLLNIENDFDQKRLLVVSDEDFKYFVKFATQISARIKLNERKTTTGDGGNLWYEETLPPETIFYSLGLCNRPRVANGSIKKPADVFEYLKTLLEDKYIQLGGNETVGQGWCSVKLIP